MPIVFIPLINEKTPQRQLLSNGFPERHQKSSHPISGKLTRILGQLLWPKLPKIGSKLM